MLKPQGIDKATKCCELTVHLLTGVRIAGTFHISTATSSTIRPSDAIRDLKDGFIVLTNATIHEATGPRSHEAIMVHANAISHIELPTKGWATKTAT